METDWKIVRIPARLEASLRTLADWHLQTDNRTKAIRKKFAEFPPRTDQEHLALWVAIFEGAKLLGASRNIDVVDVDDLAGKGKPDETNSCAA